MKIKEKNAISLIVLVITILVLSILVATVIISLSNTNIISEANDAVKKTEAQQLEEAKSLMYADGILGNNPEDMTIENYTLTWDNDKKEVVQKLGNYIVKNGAIIPTGFYYVGGTKDTGVVISDDESDENKGVDYTCVGNQFVWVPVDDYSKFVRGTAEETFEGSGIYKMTGALGSSMKEPYHPIASWTTGEKAEFWAMCTSVQKYKGFYIARFEAGDGNVSEPRTAATEAHTVVSKKGAIVYNYVPWGASTQSIATCTIGGVEKVAGAVSLSRTMYKGNTFVKSTLCYSVQWDAVMNFVSDTEHNITESNSWGNCANSSGNAAINSGRTNMNYTTGRNEAWKAKNIYDLAGNVREWSMETSQPSPGAISGNRIVRGDGFEGGANPAFRSVRTPTIAQSDVGFRPTLYLI